MDLKLCLHGVRIAHPETFTEDVAKCLKLSVKQGKLREKEYGENCSARFRRSKLSGGPLFPFKVRVMEGILLVNSHLSDLQDVEFSYSEGQENLVLAAVRKLLSGADAFAVAEPDLALRLNAMAGRPYPRVAGDTGRLKAMRRYLGWQVFIISWFWYLVYQDPGNALLVRQLRVKIRRLRSCLAFFKEGLPETPVSGWQQFFREEAESLSNMRELDVAAQVCRRLRDSAGEGTDAPETLLNLFIRLRQEAQEKFFSGTSLNRHTEKLAEFMLWLNLLQGKEFSEPGKETARHYVARRVDAWCEKMLSLSKEYTDFSDMDDMHQIRIKIKRFRYVTQTIDLTELPVDLLRQLKQLQDVLGLLHDDYVNAYWARGIALQHKDEEELQKQIQLFLSWQSARSESLLAVVSKMWENFLQMLRERQQAK